MKAINLFVVLLVFAVNAFAADPLTERLQRGLFEEEANRNLDAAIKEYQSVVTQADEQRKVVATALFRLGECYRKLGRTNEAGAFYQRIARDYSEQEQLVKLANDLLKPAVSVAGPQSELVREFQRRIVVLRVESIEQQAEADRLAHMTRAALLTTAAATNHASLVALQQQQQGVVQKLADLRGQFGEQHPEVRAKEALREVIEKQLNSVLDGIPVAARLRAESLAAQVKALDAELKKAGVTADGPANSAPEPASLTQAEAEELARVKTLARNSPDLLNARTGNTTELQKAAQAGHYSVAEFLLSQGVKPTDPLGYSPLADAAGRGHLRIVQLLLDRGAGTNDAAAALRRACEAGHKSVAETLIARGADVNSQNSYEGALYIATRQRFVSLVELLLAKGAKPDALGKVSINYMNSGNSYVNSLGATPLHEAARQGNRAIAEMLLKAGANPKATNYGGMTPLHFAANMGQSNLCALLLENGADVNFPDENGMTPFTHAISTKKADVMRLLLQRGANPDQRIAWADRSYIFPTALQLALNVNSPEVLSILLAAKPNLDIRTREYQTLVQQTVAGSQDELAILLLEAGADPDGAYNEDGYTPLHLAVSRGTNLVAALLRRGANPNVVSRRGETPLSLAMDVARRTPSQLGIVQPAPMAQQPPPGVRGPARPVRGGNSPAVSPPSPQSEIVALLKQHGADEFLQRRGFISAVRGPSQRVNIFSKGTNDVNRYTLMEFLGAVYENSGPDFPFPDFGRVVIHRLEGGTEKPFPVNVAAQMAATNCAGDLSLAWGDNIEIPMADHPVNAEWTGVAAAVYGDANPQSAALTHCLKRTVGFSAGGTNVTLPLGVWILDTRTGHGPKARQPIYRLSSVVLRDNRFRNLLRSSSDLSRVMVTRTDPQTKETKKMTFDLNAVALPDMSYSGSNPPIPWAHDLWLRDGDVIEVPEKP